jgi:hypothetical protein
MRDTGPYEATRMTALEPRLPEDPAYWDALAGRIGDDAAPVLAELYERRGAWWGSLARRSPALAAAAVVAIAAGWIAIAASGGPAAESPYAEMARAIGPTDEVGRLFLRDAAPPHVEELLPVLARTETDR